MIRSLSEENITAQMHGKSDLAVMEDNIIKKFSGNAQFRKKNCIVHHGTLILQDSLIHLAEKYLLHPPEEPDYRKHRSHNHFLTPLPAKIDLGKFSKSLQRNFQEYMGNSYYSPLFDSSQNRNTILKKTTELLQNKYSTEEYIFGR